MVTNLLKRSTRAALSAPLLATALVLGTVGAGSVAYPAHASDLAAAKATVDAAKAKGIVGEQGDGYLGLVTGSADPATIAAMQTINAGRAAVYRDTAAKSGVSVQAAGEATAHMLLAKVPPGQYYKPLNGSWTKK